MAYTDLNLKAMEKKIIAAFDFDGTLSYRDTLLPFLFFSKGRKTAFFLLLLSLPRLLLALFFKERRTFAKEALIKAFFKGEDRRSVLLFGESFAKRELSKKVRPEALKRLHWHQAQGHRVILISANLEEYLSPWAKNMGIETVLATSLQEDQRGKVTGHLASKNCRGKEKVCRLEKYLGSLDDFLLYAYGDSVGDKELLAIAQFPFLVAKGKWPPFEEKQ